MKMSWRSFFAVVREPLAPVRNAGPAAELVPIGGDELDCPVAAAEDSRLWLRVQTRNELPVGRWISIGYSSSLYDDLVRPIIRFKTAAGFHFELLPAPLFGRGSWVGHVPSGTTEIAICPAERRICAGFRLDAFAALPLYRLLASSMVQHPRLMGCALLAACIGSQSRALGLLHAAFRSSPLASYDGWRRRRLRAIDPGGLDRLRCRMDEGPHIRVVIHVEDDDSGEAIAATLNALKHQDYVNWSLVVISESDREAAMARDLLRGLDRHVIPVRPDAFVDSALAQLAGNAFVVPLVAGGTMPSYGLSMIVNFSITHPDCEMIYADEDQVDHRGIHRNPLLKPDWSPTLQRTAAYLGRAIYLRRTLLAASKITLAGQIVGDVVLRRLSSLPATQVGHLRRVLLTLPTQKYSEISVCGPWPPPIPAGLDDLALEAQATIIIPSRNRVDLLETCLKSLALTRSQAFEIVIVDNDSDEPEALSLYDRLKADPRIRILYRPGPFNFSALCNWGAAAAKTPMLVFLNNDVVVHTADWLKRLIWWALQPNIGAVGTKLIYPSGRLQHAGVVIGLGGYSAHNDRDAQPSDPGYLRKLASDREVLAVTGACLAVEKVKFESVGGFDERAFPVEFSDIDLCLRLRGSGWTAICLSEPILTHRESATRGVPQDKVSTYGRERRAFRDRWHRYIRDDPYFHPALSLHSAATALDQ